MTALLQADSKSGRPVLLHYSLSGGHSAGVSVEQQIQDDTDELTFLWTETGQPTCTQVTPALSEGAARVPKQGVSARNLMPQEGFPIKEIPIR